MERTIEITKIYSFSNFHRKKQVPGSRRRTMRHFTNSQKYFWKIDFEKEKHKEISRVHIDRTFLVHNMRNAEQLSMISGGKGNNYKNQAQNSTPKNGTSAASDPHTFA